MKYSTDILLLELQQYWEQFGHPPKCKKFHIHENVYRHVFGSWNNALTAAGIPTRSEFNKLDVTCKQCGECFRVTKGTARQFCSLSCAATYNNARREHRRRNSRTRQARYCVNCNDVLDRQTTYCSSVCQGEYKKKETVRKWLAGEITGNYGKKVQLGSNIRNYLIEQADYKCSRCGWGEAHPLDGKVPLEIDHIDGNAENSTPNNLRVLCPNCHSLTDGYKARNRGNSSRVYK